jgi:hypothetical protein
MSDLIIVSGAPGVGKSTVSRLVAATFDRSVHLQSDDLMASVVSGWVDPNLPEAEQQNEAIGAALAVSAMRLADDGYTTVVDGYLFPVGVAGLAAACTARRLSCHYVVLTADLELHERHVVGATGSPENACDAVLSAFRSGKLSWRTMSKEAVELRSREG